MADLANPQSSALMPTVLLAAFFDAGTGMRLHIILHFMVAFAGMWTWARSRQIADPWALAAALVFVMAGFFSERATGHVSFMAFAFVPWILWCFERAAADMRFAVFGGGFVRSVVVNMI